MSGFRCIKLNSSWQPIEIMPWDVAFNHAYIHGKVDVLWTYPEEYKIRSASSTWKYPSIIVLQKHVRHRPEKKNISPSLKSILTRDLYTCQYCSCRLTNTTGTRDHIVPVSKGGPTTWSNLVACCRDCQNKKSNKSCQEANMFPLKVAAAPALSERFSKAIMKASNFERNNWRIGMKKIGLTNILDCSGD